MRSYPFDRPDDESLILVEAQINESALTLALDTGATHTVIDLTALLLAGIEFSKNAPTAKLETASGVVEAKIFEVAEFECLGVKRENFQVHSYDYLANQVLSDIDGVLGLDFFEGYKFCIDTVNQVVSIEKVIEK